MKRLFLTCAIATICFGLCSVATANPTLTLSGSSQSESTSTNVVTKDSDDSEFFLKDWFYWLLDDVFGWDRSDGKKRYYTKSTGIEPDSGDQNGDSGSDDDWDFDYGDWDSGSGNDDWDSGAGDWDFGSGDDGTGGDTGDNGDGGTGYDAGDGGTDYNPGGDGWGFDPDNDGWDNDSGGDGWDVDPGADWDPGTSPPQTIPAPGALVLGGIGSCLVTWLRRNKSL